MHKRRILFLFLVIALCSKPVVANASPAAGDAADITYEEPYMVTEQNEDLGIQGDVSDSDESFSEFAEQYAKSTGATVLFSSAAAQTDGKYLKIASVTTMKDADGHIYAILDVFNTSNETIRLGLTSVTVNGTATPIAAWKSEVVHPGKHIMITVPIDGIATQNDNAALSLHVYGTDLKERMTSSLINIITK